MNAYINDTACPSCGSSRTSIIRMPSYHTYHAATKCGECDTFLRWEPKPKTQQKQKQRQQPIKRLLVSPNLSQWERDFLTSVNGQKKLSPKQQEALSRIEAKVGGTAL